MISASALFVGIAMGIVSPLIAVAAAGVRAGAERLCCLLGAAAVLGLGCAAALSMPGVAFPVVAASLTAFGLLLLVSGVLGRRGYRYATGGQLRAATRMVAGDELPAARFGLRDLLLLQAVAALAALAAVLILPRWPLQQRLTAHDVWVGLAIGLSGGGAAMAGLWLLAGHATAWRRFAMAAVLLTAATILLRGVGFALLLVEQLDPSRRIPIVENFADAENTLVTMILLSASASLAATLTARVAGYHWVDWPFE